MKKYTDTGHYSNIINFEKMIIICSSFNGNYNPSTEIISIEGLQKKHKSVFDAYKAVIVAETDLKIAKAHRKDAFGMINKLITRYKNAFIACDVPTSAIENSRRIVRKIRGQRVSRRKTEEEKAIALEEGYKIVEHSSSQTSFESKVENIKNFINYLTIFPGYKPSEEILSLASLNSICNNLEAKNQNVNDAEIKAKSMRIERDHELYNQIDGLITIANKVKAYIKSIYGATSPQFRQISKLRFSKH